MAIEIRQQKKEWWCLFLFFSPLLCSLAIATEVASAKSRDTQEEFSPENIKFVLIKLFHSLYEPGESSKTRVWPELEFGLRVVLGSIIGFLGAALGSIGGVGGGGIFVPMLTLIIGFDPKTSTG